MSRPTYFPFRQQARKHLKNAEELLAGEGQQLIYACLELRLAIEAIVYETLQAYEKNLTPDVAEAYKHWQPSKVLELLCRHDPLADTSLRVEVREVADDGGPAAGPPFFEGIDNRLTAEWIEKAHRSLGSFLHQRTISQLEKGKPIDEVKLKTEATRIGVRLGEVLKGDVHSIRITGGFQFPCETCHTILTVMMAPLILEGFGDIQCTSCKTTHSIEIDRVTGEIRFGPSAATPR